MEGIQIRELKTEDADAIATIYEAIVRQSVEDDFKALVETHARSKKDICYVAELDGQVIGFMISYVLTLGFGIEKSGWIATLGVDPEFMGQGIGDRLARKVFDIYKQIGITRVYTSVRWDSTDLLSFFKTLGFDRSNFVNLKKDL